VFAAQGFEDLTEMLQVCSCLVVVLWVPVDNAAKAA
jgi:hypothetical protein